VVEEQDLHQQQGQVQADISIYAVVMAAILLAVRHLLDLVALQRQEDQQPAQDLDTGQAEGQAIRRDLAVLLADILSISCLLSLET
jgi:hypothetical protein